MIVSCKKDSCDYPVLVLPKSIENVLDEGNFISSSEWHTLNAEEVGFSISIGTEYYVYGLLQHHDQIRFLLMDDNNMPGFFPSLLFEISKGDIPSGWYVNKFEIGEKDLLITADPMLINTYEDLKSIIEYEDSFIRSILDYKQYLEKYCT